VCMGPSDPHPNWHLGMRGTQHRAVFWRVWKEGGTGFLYWGANCYEKASVPSAEVAWPHGLIYKLERYLLEVPYVYVCLLKCCVCLSR
jgi:hypothetical protein